jgi:hypothetical protein
MRVLAPESSSKYFTPCVSDPSTSTLSQRHSRSSSEVLLLALNDSRSLSSERCFQSSRVSASLRTAASKLKYQGLMAKATS